MADVERCISTRNKTSPLTQTVERYGEYAMHIELEMDAFNVKLGFPNFGTTEVTMTESWAYVVDEDDNILASEQIRWGGTPGTVNSDTGDDYAFWSDNIAIWANKPRGTIAILAPSFDVVGTFGHPTTGLLVPVMGDRYNFSDTPFTPSTADPFSIPEATNPVIHACRCIFPCAIKGTVEELPGSDEVWQDLSRAPCDLAGGNSRNGGQQDFNGDGDSGISQGLRLRHIPYMSRGAFGSTEDSFVAFLQTDYGTELLGLADCVSSHFGVNSIHSQPDTEATGEAVYALKENTADAVNTLYPGKPFIIGTSWIPNTSAVDNGILTGYGLTAMLTLNALCRAATQVEIPNLMMLAGGDFACFDDELIINGAPEDITAMRVFTPANFAIVDFGSGLHLDAGGHEVQATTWGPLVTAWTIGEEGGGGGGGDETGRTRVSWRPRPILGRRSGRPDTL